MFGFQLLVIVGCIVCFWYVISLFYRKRQTGRLKRACANGKVIVLTFDDGPSASLTAKILTLLKKRKQPATFFVLGDSVAKLPDVVKQITEDGHEIGSHTYSHSNAWKTSPWGYSADIIAGKSALSDVGIETNLFRPPFGKSTFGVLIQSWLSGLKLAFWTIDSQDSWDRRAIPDILDEIRSNNGGVILMHDRERPLRGPSPEKHHDYLLKLTTAILDLAEEHEFKVMRFGELAMKIKDA